MITAVAASLLANSAADFLLISAVKLPTWTASRRGVGSRRYQFGAEPLDIGLRGCQRGLNLGAERVSLIGLSIENAADKLDQHLVQVFAMLV